MKVGDSVKLKPAMGQGIKPESYGLSFTGEYVVSSFADTKYSSITLEGFAGNWDADAFQVVKYQGARFQVEVLGTKVYDVEELKDGSWSFYLGTQKTFHYPSAAVNVHLSQGNWKVLDKSIERPVLEERKKDKVRMELVDQGFPLALLELAKVMTWANNNKGYKDHDWRNIPDAENAFKGAAARHRVKFDAQRSFGSEMLDCTDEESGIIHLAHECFNILALLELALAGKVK